MPTACPTTSNIGDGVVKTFEAQASGRSLPALLVDASLTLANSRLAKPAPAFADDDERNLPNIPHVGRE